MGWALFTTVAWWVFFSTRSAVGLILPRDAVSYAVGALAFVIALLTIRRLPSRGPVVFLGAFTLYTFLQFVARDDYRKVQVQSLVQIVFPIAFFCIGYLLWRNRRYDIALKTYVAVMAFSAFVGLANYYAGFAQPLFLLNQFDRTEVGSQVVQRGGSLAGGSIGTGLFAGLGILIALGLPKRYQWSIPIFIMSMVSTLSRGGIIAIAAGIPIYLWFSLPTPGRERTRTLRRRGALVGLVLLIALVGGISSGDQGDKGNVFLDRFTVDFLNPKEEGNAYRIASWEHDIDVWSESPVFGAGLGILGTIGVTDARANGSEALAAESWYLQILGELGAIGLSVYLLMLFGIVMEGWQAISEGERGKDRLLAIAAMGGLMALTIGGVFLQNLGDLNGSLFWYFAGGLVAYRSEQLSTLAQGRLARSSPIPLP